MHETCFCRHCGVCSATPAWKGSCRWERVRLAAVVVVATHLLSLASALAAAALACYRLGPTRPSSPCSVLAASRWAVRAHRLLTCSPQRPVGRSRAASRPSVAHTPLRRSIRAMATAALLTWAPWADRYVLVIWLEG